MKEILPISYKYNIGGMILGIVCIIVSIGGILISSIIGQEDDYENFIIVGIIFLIIGIGTLIYTVKANSHIIQKRKWRKDIKTKTCVKGYIEKIEESVSKYNSKYYSENDPEGASRNYSLVVRYFDPIDMREKITTSEPYYEMLNNCLESREVNVYIDNEGNTLIDDIKVRKSLKSPGVNLDNSGSHTSSNNIEYFISRYDKLLTVVGIIIGIMIFVFIFMKGRFL